MFSQDQLRKKLKMPVSNVEDASKLMFERYKHDRSTMIPPLMFSSFARIIHPDPSKWDKKDRQSKIEYGRCMRGEDTERSLFHDLEENIFYSDNDDDDEVVIFHEYKSDSSKYRELLIGCEFDFLLISKRHKLINYVEAKTTPNTKIGMQGDRFVDHMSRFFGSY